MYLSSPARWWTAYHKLGRNIRAWGIGPNEIMRARLLLAESHVVTQKLGCAAEDPGDGVDVFRSLQNLEEVVQYGRQEFEVALASAKEARLGSER